MLTNSGGKLEFIVTALLLAGLIVTFPWHHKRSSQDKLEPFYSSVRETRLCTSRSGDAVSHAGYVGLTGDTEETPRRAFFWYFEAQEDPVNAPVILTIGGGPGSTGLLNPLWGQSHCLVRANGTTTPNPDAWSERFNLLALDHARLSAGRPVRRLTFRLGVGLSYGASVNNSRAAAYDAYDFLQKFYTLFPHVLKNPLIVAAGSHGGIYVPHIATVIHHQNGQIARGRGQPGASRINLESLMISNPLSDTLSYFRWVLQHRCYYTDVYNATTCTELYRLLPTCLEKLEYAFGNFTVNNRKHAWDACEPLDLGDTHGKVLYDIRSKCTGPLTECYSEYRWITDFFENTTVRQELGVPDHVHFQTFSLEVNLEFDKTVDQVQRAHLMYEPLLKDGIRLLHYIGGKDANSAWPGVLSFLKLLRTPFQERFIGAPDVAWREGEATVRVVGDGAGNMTYILIAEAGHFVVKDQPALVKTIVEHWIDNRAFV